MRFFRQQREQSSSTDHSSFIQPKLKVGKPGDKYEVEADKMADQVVNKTSLNSESGIQKKGSQEEEIQQKSLASSITPLVQTSLFKDKNEGSIQKMEEEETVQKQEKEEEPIQTKCAECQDEEKVQRQTEEEEPAQMMAKEEEDVIKASTDEEQGAKMQAKMDTTLQSKEKEEELKATAGEHNTSRNVETNLANSIGKGSPMQENIKAEMEQGFGADFSHVKIHTGSQAQQMSQDLGAQAFTRGNDVYFNKGKYNPSSTQGKHLLAHELTHTIQQKGMVQKKIQRRIGDGHDFLPTSRFSGNAILEATFDNLTTVKTNKNSSGAHVTLIQQALVGLGYPLPLFGVDGSFGDETKRAVEAFQEDVGVTVDGKVGPNTIDFLDKRDRGADVAPPALPVAVNVPIDLNNVIAQPGAVPSTALGAGEWGFTFPENVQVRIDVFDNGGVWQPVLTGVTGNYSMQTRLLPGVAEVTGPGGNTTAANYCNQINDLNNLSLVKGNFFMQAAILAHERVHAEKFRDALIDPTVITPLETAIEGVTLPKSAITPNAGFAEFFIRTNPAFQSALTAAQANWLSQILVLVAADHGAPFGTGPTYTEEREIVGPMIRRICNHARANRFPGCAPLCP